MDVCIAGAGLAGLSLGYALRGKVNVKILEATSAIGGLLKSKNIEDWTFDIGGSHIIFSKDRKILKEILDLIEYVGHKRRTFIVYKNRFIEYPFENGIYALSKNERFEILRDFVSNLISEKNTPKNLLEWFYYVFGKAITEKYLKPYNEKIWKRDLRQISLEWVGGRVPNPPVDDVLRSAVGIRTEGYTHQARFYYPISGGIHTLAKKIAERLNVKTSTPVKKVKLESNKIIVNGEIECDKFVYTAPLSEVWKIIGDKEVRDLCKKLEYNSLTVVGLGVKGKVPNIHWLYIPQKDIIFHRLAFLSNYSPNMAPNNSSTIILEISHGEEKLRNLEQDVIEGLKKLGFDFNIEIFESWSWKYAYIVYNHEYSETVETLRKILREKGIIPFGRFGNWEYLNMDAVWSKAKELARKIEYESVGSDTE